MYEPQAPIILKDNKNWGIVLDAMHSTAQKVGATAYPPFKGSKYDAAGKTGSAQVARREQGEKYDAKTTSENKRDNAMFIAFAPFDKPEIVVAVAIENVAKGGGGTNAGPVARQIMDQYFGDRVIETNLTVKNALTTKHENVITETRLTQHRGHIHQAHSEPTILPTINLHETD